MTKMGMKIYESKSSKMWMLVAAIAIIVLGVAFLLAKSAVIGIYFVFIGAITIPYTIMRFNYKLPIIESDERELRITYNGQKLLLQWGDIQDCKLKYGISRNGYVPSFLIISLRSGIKHQVLLPVLTVDKEEIVTVINRNATKN